MQLRINLHSTRGAVSKITNNHVINENNIIFYQRKCFVRVFIIYFVLHKIYTNLENYTQKKINSPSSAIIKKIIRKDRKLNLFQMWVYDQNITIN